MDKLRVRFKVTMALLVVLIVASTVVACLYTLYWAKDDRNTADTGVEKQYRGAGDTSDADKQSTETQDTEKEIGSRSGMINDTKSEEINRETTEPIIPDESNILREMMNQPVTTDIPMSSIIVMTRIQDEVNDDEEEEESWEDFGWEKERTSVKSTTKVTIPPFLLEDIGGDWADDLQEEWEE